MKEKEMSKYTDLLTRSKEDQEKALAPARAQEQQAQLLLQRTKLSLEIKTQEASIGSLKGRYPLPVMEILDAADSLDLAQRQLKQLDDLNAELFGA
jgi:hypothetical protein